MRRGCGGSSARRPAGPKFALLFSSGIDILHLGQITNAEQPLTIDPAQNTYPYEGEQPPKRGAVEAKPQQGRALRRRLLPIEPDPRQLPEPANLPARQA